MQIRWPTFGPGVFVLFLGGWAFFAPGSFYDTVATYPPYNEHLFHDIGAFMLGLGAALVWTAWTRDGATIALGANAVAAVFHAWAHIIDRDQGGRSSDPIALSLVAVLIIGLLMRRAARRRAEV